MCVHTYKVLFCRRCSGMYSKGDMSRKLDRQETHRKGCNVHVSRSGKLQILPCKYGRMSSSSKFCHRLCILLNKSGNSDYVCIYFVTLLHFFLSKNWAESKFCLHTKKEKDYIKFLYPCENIVTQGALRCGIFGFCFFSFPQNARKVYKLRQLSLSQFVYFFEGSVFTFQ